MSLGILSIAHKIINYELPDIPRYQFWVSLTVLLITIGVMYPFVLAITNGAIPTNATEILNATGPTEAITSVYYRQIQTGGTGRKIIFWLILMLLMFNIAWQISLNYLAYSRYESETGRPYPNRELFSLMGMNALVTFITPLFLATLGLLTYVFYGEYQVGAQWLNQMQQVSHQILAHIPTLVEVPYPLPIVLVAMIAGFFGYWIHRICHETRLGWLLVHRNHHLAPNLITPVAGPVYVTIPLMLIFAIPYGVLNGIATKLFTLEPMYLEATIISVIFAFIGPHAHATALYRMGRQNTILYTLGKISGGGVFHYMHHSAKPEHLLCNMGGGYWMIWDRLFKTYFEPPIAPPPVGLCNQPTIHWNPFRLAFGGIMQIIYEWRHNKDWKTRLKILFASSAYTPPYSKDFVIKDELCQ